MSKIPIDPNSLFGKLRLSIVPRWSIISMSRQQSVAEHTYNVMVILNHILNEYFDDKFVDGFEINRNYLMVYALEHDVEEIITGDTPNTNKPVDSFNPIVKLADNIEAYIYVAKYCNDSPKIERWVLNSLYNRIKYYSDECHSRYTVHIDWKKIIEEAIGE